MIKIDKERCVGCGQCVSDCIKNCLIIREPEHKVDVAVNSCFACGHCEAICPVGAIVIEGMSNEAFPDFDLCDASVDAKDLASFMANIRSVRHFKKMPVEQEKIDMIINAGRFAPTGCNYQHTGYIVIKDRLDEVCKTASMSLCGDVLNELSKNINRDTLEKIYNTASEGTDDRLFFHAPLVIALTDIDGSNGVDIGIAASRMELMANALGLGVCFNGIFPAIANKSRELKQLFALPEDRKIVLTIIIGYPDVKYMRPAKRKRAKITNM